MDGSSFDKLAHFVAADGSRRGLLRSALAAAVGGAGATAFLSPEETEAKSCKAKCNKKKTAKKRARCKKKCDNGQRVECKSENASCSSPEGQTGECCASLNLVCDVPFGAGNSDTKCCPGPGAFCTPPGSSGPKCCVGEGGEREYECRNNTCVRTV